MDLQREIMSRGGNDVGEIKKSRMVDVPLLVNMRRTINQVNRELESYLDMDKNFQEDIIDLDEMLSQVICDLNSFIELCIKFRLMQEHWAFIFDDINNASEDMLESGDFYSVTLVKGVKRLKNLCDNSISLDECLKLNKLRNKVQHFTLTPEPLTNVLTILSSAMIQTSDFVVSHVLPYIDIKDAITEFTSIYTELKSNGNELKRISMLHA